MGRRRALDVAALLLLVGCAAVLRWQARDRWSLDLMPRPDALEYARVADRLLDEGAWTLELAGHEIPSRYPPGTSLGLLPVLAWPNAQLWHAYVASLVYGLLTVALLYLLLRQWCSVAAALVGTAMLVVSPTHVHFSVLAMSEVPSCLAVLVVFLVGLPLLRESSGELRGRALATGFLAGLATLLRYPNGLIGLCLVLALGLFRSGRRSAFWAALGLGFGCLPVLLYNQLVFGEFWHTGYRYWEPNDYLQLQDCVALRFLFEPVNPAWETGNLAYYTQILLGFDRTLWAWPTAALAAVGAVVMLRSKRRLFWATLLFVAGTYLFYSCYFFRAGRLLIVLLPMVCLWAALGLQAALLPLRRFGRLPALVLPVAVLTLTATLAFGWDRDDAVKSKQHDTLSSLYQQRFGATDLAIHPSLAPLFTQLPEAALVVLDFPRLLAEPYQRPGQILLNLAERSSAVHTAWAWGNELISPAGKPIRPPVLVRKDGQLEESSLRQINAHLQQGGPAFLCFAPRTTALQLDEIPQLLKAHFALTPRPGVGRLVVVELTSRRP